MKICFNHLLLAFSYALDCVEKDYCYISHFHGKRVTYFSMKMGEYFQLNQEEINHLLACAILHDNGMSEYYKDGEHLDVNDFLKVHCIAGERNMNYLPFYHHIEDVVLYHHERIDGKGPFHKVEKDIPLYSQIIHLADWVDIHYSFKKMDPIGYQKMLNDIKELEGIHFSQKVIQAFISTLTFEVIEQDLYTLNYELKNNDYLIYREIPHSQVLSICQLFAHIIDSKSPHTRSHSTGVATLVSQMAMYYDNDQDKIMQLFIAGVLHDVGKLVIDRDILEKPAQLTDCEYTYMQTHAYYTYRILTDMDLGDIVHWASFHHEKLDGSGYPFGKVGDELDFNDRLMACCDIYQALTEKRPYKEALSHQKTIEIMRNMATMNKIDGQIVEDMNKIFGD
ncbi:MAG: HD domain-containing protein [Coprobacillus cateniformis]|uniref:HD domain-containing phosphohydrolase n=1 Tax=Longibaculum muris TaxID=1796628 RepID=UPI0029FEE13B|nr:HD domain-containing protein [Coprobacillus cateniformis]